MKRALKLLVWLAFFIISSNAVKAQPITNIDSPPNASISDNSPILYFTVSKPSNITYNWDGEVNITGCLNCTSYNTTYGEVNLSGTILALHLNEQTGNRTYDSSGNGFNGLVENYHKVGTSDAVFDWTNESTGTAKFGGGLNFKNMNDQQENLNYQGINVSGPDGSVYISNFNLTYNFTVMLWIYPREVNADGTILTWGKGGQDASPYTGDGKGYELTGVNRKFGFDVNYRNHTNVLLQSSSTFNLNQWYHIVGRVNSTDATLFINGEESVTKYLRVPGLDGRDIIDSNNWLGNTLMVHADGKIYPEGDVTTTGYYDEIYIFNRALSNTGISSYYSKSLSDGQHNVTVYANDTLGNMGSATVYFTVNALPDIVIWTDKTEYTTGDTMHVGLNLSNPSGETNVGIYIWADKPDRSKHWFVKEPNATLQPGLSYSNSEWKPITLPSIPSGDYAWHAVLADPDTGDIISESIAPWTFGGKAAKSNGMKAFERKLEGAPEIEGL